MSPKPNSKPSPKPNPKSKSSPKKSSASATSQDGITVGGGWIYTDIVKDHFLHPRNFLMGDESKFVCDAVGLVGNPICGDQMKMFIRVKDDKIVDLAWKTYGCASAIASTSALSELAKGKTLDQALEITAEDIDNYLGKLPKHKFHCSILGHDALKNAIDNYRHKK